MTLVFDDMVKAMAAEVRRQSAESDIIHYADGPTAVGAIDLEKVARAGLVAIREPDSLWRDISSDVDESPVTCAVVWQTVVDKILE